MQFKFEPKPDITTYELAIVLRYLVHGPKVAGSAGVDVYERHLASHDWHMTKRHFVECEDKK